MAGAAVVGREDVLGAASRALAGGQSVSLVGAAGVGKSTVLGVLRAGVMVDRRVLASCPAEPDAQLPFVTLIDLLSPVEDRIFDQVSGASRRALDAALLKRETPARDLDRLAVRLGVLELLRLVATDGSTVLLVDDAHWMDPASGEVLSFALRRLAGAGVQVLAAERLGEGETSPARSWLPDDAVELVVSALSDEALVPVLLERAGGLLSRGLALQVCQLAAGNPFLALEIVDAVRRRGQRLVQGEPLPVPARLDGLMRQRLASFPDSARDTLRVAAAAARPTLTLLGKAGCATAMDDLMVASAAGIADLAVDGSVGFEHPLVRAAVYAQAGAMARVDVHARLAGAVVDPIERARHLARAMVVEDEGVAAALIDAAAAARRRGAVDVAFELAGLAAQRTPEADRPAWAERKLAQGWHGYAAGMMDEARDAAAEVLAADVPRELRARAWLLLLEATGQRIGQAGEQIRAALADTAGDRVNEPWVWVHVAWHHIASGRFGEGLTAAARAAELAATNGSAAAEMRALEAAMGAQRRLGEDTSATMARAARLVEDSDVGGLAWIVYCDLGRDLLEADRFREARDMFRRAVAVAAEDAAHTLDSHVALRFLRKVELRLGNCAAVMELAAQIRHLSDDENLGLGGMAEAELAGGTLVRAESLAQRAIAASQRVGDHDSLLWYWHLLTACRLVAGDPAGAIGYVRRAEEHRGNEGLTSRVRLLRIDLVEALARVGELTGARAVLAELTAPAGRPPSPSTTAATDRAEAVLLLAEGHSDAAAELLEQVLGVQSELGMRLEEVRTLVAAAEVERRRRRRGTARTLLDRAREICVAVKAGPWLARVDEELARLRPSAGRPGDEVLTPTEERIVAMAVKGATNREIATALSIGLSTVEGSLSQIYRKLGVRSRVELVRLRQPTS